MIKRVLPFVKRVAVIYLAATVSIAAAFFVGGFVYAALGYAN